MKKIATNAWAIKPIGRIASPTVSSPAIKGVYPQISQIGADF
jgi:hypothetical protein